VVESAVGERLSALAPGAALARLIAEVDARVLSGHDLVEYIAACERMCSWALGSQFAAIAEFAARCADAALLRPPVPGTGSRPGW
jgi:hypothetical protein